MLQSLDAPVINRYDQFPFYGTCDMKPSHSAITLSGDITEETLPNGNIKVSSSRGLSGGMRVHGLIRPGPHAAPHTTHTRLFHSWPATPT